MPDETTSTSAADRLRALMHAAPGAVSEKAAAAGMSISQWMQYAAGARTPGLDLTERILGAIGRTFADLDKQKS